MRAAAIVPAAGLGLRMHSRRPKVLLPLLGRPLLAWTLEPLRQSGLFSEILVAYPEEEREAFVECLGGLLKEIAVHLIRGGETRQDSVWNCIKQMGGDNSLVAVHDGARPLVTQALLRKTLEKAEETGAAIAAVPCKDTVKWCDERNVVKQTFEREHLRLVQTPQCFRTDILKRAYEEAGREGFSATDDSLLVERLGVEVHVVMGSYENIKVTTPEDIAVCEEILKRRSSGASGRRL
jgi:2-C-methyl-D-erythritol 4-phosphate cytidylyltransferase